MRHRWSSSVKYNHGRCDIDDLESVGCLESVGWWDRRVLCVMLTHNTACTDDVDDNTSMTHMMTSACTYIPITAWMRLCLIIHVPSSMSHHPCFVFKCREEIAMNGKAWMRLCLIIYLWSSMFHAWSSTSRLESGLYTITSWNIESLYHHLLKTRMVFQCPDYHLSDRW